MSDDIDIEKTAELLNFYNEIYNIEYPSIEEELSFTDGIIKGFHKGWDEAKQRERNRIFMALFNIMSDNNIIGNNMNNLTKLESDIFKLTSYFKNDINKEI